MRRSLWYLVKTLILVGIGVYLAVLPGSVRVTWQDYVLTVQSGIAALLIFLALIAVSLLTGFIDDAFFLLREWRHLRRERRRGKGHKALMRSLSAASAGDYKNAYYLAHRAEKLLPQNETGLAFLLQAHAAKNRGHTGDSEAAFRALLDNADTAVLGIQGLIQKETLSGNFGRALELARDSLETQPRNKHLLRPVYDLEIRNRLWGEALDTLERIQSAKTLAPENIESDRSAILIVLGDEARAEGRLNLASKLYKKAFQSDPASVSATLRFASASFEMGQRVAALSAVKKNWAMTGNPELLPLWRRLCPQDKKNQRLTEYNWMEWVAGIHPDNHQAWLSVAETAIDHGMWGEAQTALSRAETLGESREFFLLQVRLEEATDGSAEDIRLWLDRAASAPVIPKWICRRTGRHFDQWMPVVEPEGFFNTLEWCPAVASRDLENQDPGPAFLGSADHITE